MSESAPEATVEDGKAVYDYAELRYVDNLPGKSARETAAELNKSNKGFDGRVDGSSGKRYAVS